MYYECMAEDCRHCFDAKEKNGKFIFFTNCPKCGSVAELREVSLTPREFMQAQGKTNIEQIYHSMFDSLSDCPFAYDCYQVGEYVSACEVQMQIEHRCLVHLDNKLYHLEKKLDKILAHLEKS